MTTVHELREGMLLSPKRGTLLKVSGPDPDSPNPGATMTVLLEDDQPPSRTTVRWYNALAIQVMGEPSDRLMAILEDHYPTLSQPITRRAALADGWEHGVRPEESA